MLKKITRTLLAVSLAGFLLNGTQVSANEMHTREKNYSDEFGEVSYFTDEVELIEIIEVDTSLLRDTDYLFKTIYVFSDGTTLTETSKLISSVVTYDEITDDENKTEKSSTSGSIENRYEVSITGRNPNNLSVWAVSEWQHDVHGVWNSRNNTSSMTYVWCTNLRQGFTQRDSRDPDGRPSVGRNGSNAWFRYISMATSDRVHYTYNISTNGVMSQNRNNLRPN